jgi:hypothetical protein
MTNHIIYSTDGQTYDLTTNRIAFGLLPEDVQDAMKAWPHGWEIFNHLRWEHWPAPSWGSASTYRSIPAPKVSEHVLYWKDGHGSWPYRHDSDTHRITLRDGQGQHDRNSGEAVMTDTTTEYGDFTPINVASSTKLMLELSEMELTMKNASDTLSALAAERDTLTARVKGLEGALTLEPTDDTLASACISYRHDFGLLNENERKTVMWQAKEWWRAVAKEMSARALTQKDKTRG